jgi:hypothetical protein
MVASQSAINLVENTECTAVSAFTFPAAIGAMQYGRIASAIEQQHALLTFGYPRLNGRNQRR